MKLVANFRRVAGYKKPIEAGETFEADNVLGAVLISRGEAKLYVADPPKPPVLKPVPKPPVVDKKEVAVAPKAETR